MPDYLTKRNGHWQFVRRVPLEFAALDPRGIIKHSTKVPIHADKRGHKAGRIADAMNRELEAYWRGLTEGRAQEAADRYAEARRRARVLGFDYADMAEIAGKRPLAEVLERLEKLVAGGLVEDAGARAAVLGYEQRPSVKLSEVFPQFEKLSRNYLKDKSRNQLRVWTGAYRHALANFIAVVGDKSLHEITHADVLDYIEWLEDRVAGDDIVAKTANKQISHVSRMIKELNRKLRLGLPSLFADMMFRGEKNVTRPPFDPEFVQNKMLAEGALMGLNAEARRTIMLIADTGLRLSEAINLNENAIHLDCAVPYVEVLPEGRHVKTAESVREIPLVGVALAAMKLQPKGFPKYVDRGPQFSMEVNRYLTAHGLRPTPKHTLYSLRHTFKDRLVAAKCQDSMIEALMGHADEHPKYGAGPSLALKLEALHAIAFRPPVVL